MGRFTDDLYYTATWWGEAFNPFQPIQQTVSKKGLAQKAAAGTVGAASLWSVYALSGGGASHHIAREIARPSLIRASALKVDSYRAIASGAGRTMGFLARKGLPRLPAIAAGLFAIDMVANPTTSLFASGVTSVLEWIDPWNISDFTFMD